MRLSQLINLPIEEHTPKPIGKRSWLIDLPVKAYGLANGKKNILTYDFYAVLFNRLTGAGIRVIDYVNGSTDTLTNEGGSGGGLGIYTDVKPITFSNFVVGSAPYHIANADLIFSFVEQSDRLIISTSGIAIHDGQTIIRVWSLGTASADFKALGIAGRNITVEKDQTITWRIYLFEPILKNTGYILHGINSGTNPSGLLDLNGASHDIRVNDMHTAFASGTCRVQFGTSNAPFSFSDYMITDPIDVTPDVGWYVPSDYKYIIVLLTCYVTPTSDTEVYEIGIVRTLYDTGGNTYDALLARMVLSTPITLYGGKTNFVLIRLFAKE